MSSAKSRVSKLVRNWVSSGSNPQEAFSWAKSIDNWTRDLPEMGDFIRSLPNSIDRTYLHEIIQDADFSPVEMFTATMIWGYGDIGYGSYRVKKMFQSGNFVRKIEDSFSMCQGNDPLNAYLYLSKNRIDQLGPAFGTKWISFATPRETPAPIYDSLISKWIATFAASEFQGISLNPEVWSLKTYSSYYSWMNLIANENSIKSDDLESILFEEASKLFSKKIQ